MLPPGVPSVLAAGDIATCSGHGDEETAALLDHLPGTVLAVGDDAYPSGSASDFARCYAPTWGRHRARTRPAPGNHEYRSPGAAPYFAYFGAAAGPAGRGYHSFDVGTGSGAWHVISLNSNIGMAAGSAQERWLRADLAAHPARCTLAYWHHPRFSSGAHGSTARVAPLWRALAEGGADVVIQGHDHDYERFARLSADGRPDSAGGLRSFVVGTGGAGLRRFRPFRVRGSEVRDRRAHGVLRLALYPNRYTWAFVRTDGAIGDRGGEACR